MRSAKRRHVSASGDVFDTDDKLIRWNYLQELYKNGQIYRLTRNPTFRIDIKDRRICTVVLDFQYWLGDAMVYEVVEASNSALASLKFALVEAIYDIKISVIRGRRGSAA